jgi:hypothetical protein
MHFLTARLQKALEKSGSIIAVSLRGTCGVAWNLYHSQSEDSCEKGRRCESKLLLDINGMLSSR